MEAAMFLRGFICGWLGVAALVTILVWGMTARMTNGGTEFGYAPSYDMGVDYWAC
jgi:hypothetical protein